MLCSTDGFPCNFKVYTGKDPLRNGSLGAHTAHVNRKNLKKDGPRTDDYDSNVTIMSSQSSDSCPVNAAVISLAALLKKS